MAHDGVNPSHCLFDQPWWLEAVAPGEWGETVLEDNGTVQARLPYVIRRRLGVVALTQPVLTPTLGPWTASSSAAYATALAREHKAMGGLIDSLPRFDVFRQAFHPSVMNWLPFHWRGFQATVLYTYRVEELTDLDRIWSGFRESVRREIRKAGRSVTVRTDLGLSSFLELNEKTFRRQNLALPYSRESVERLDAACAVRDARRVFFAVDELDRLHAALYVVWDSNTAYYLMSGADPTLRTSGAGSLLAWEAIRFCSGVTRSFDFEGSMIPSVERFFRAFGARQVPYLYVTKRNLKGRAADTARKASTAARSVPNRTRLQRSRPGDSRQRVEGVSTNRDPTAGTERPRPTV
jgi:hypothetical protein